MTPGQILDRIRGLLRCGDPNLFAQVVELLEVVGTLEVFDGLCEGIGVMHEQPTAERSSVLAGVGDPTHRIDLAVWMLRRAGRLDGVSVLNLRHISRSGFAEIEGLTSLETLTLRDVGWATDLSPVLRLPNLKVLHLEPDGFDLSPLAGHSSLQELSVSGYSDDIAASLESLPALRSLMLRLPRDFDPHRLQTLPRLTTLSITGALGDLSWLPRFPALTSLGLSCARGAHVTSLAPLSALTGLTTLTVKEHQVEAPLDITPLSGLTELESVTLPELLGIDFTPLHGLPRLRSISIADSNYFSAPRPAPSLYRSLRPMHRLLEGWGWIRPGRRLEMVAPCRAPARSAPPPRRGSAPHPHQLWPVRY
ncbi:MAG: hypothetical protein ACI8RZ_005586 [Myxococcota bacterium]|jgi:hypothetical protein